MRTLLWTMGLVLMALASRGLEDAPPEQVGLSPAGLQELTQYLQEEVQAGRVAGAVGLVARHGKIGYFEAVGLRDRESGAMMTTNTLFRIASMTKAVTSMAIMMLVEEGVLGLQDPLGDHLPEFADARVLTGQGNATRPARRPITIHDLLTHTSGMGYGWFGAEPQVQAYRQAGVTDWLVPSQATLADRVKRVGPLPLAFQPGEQWSYGLSIDVLGRVVEVVSGLTLNQFFRERIFRPLDMKNTHFFLPAAKQSRLAALYTPGPDKQGLQRVGSKVLASGPIRFSADYCLEGKSQLLAGGSGLVGSTLDYARFLQVILDQGHPLLQSASLRTMTRNQIGSLRVPFPGHGDGFGYGFGVLTERGAAQDVARVGTVSWGGIFNTYFWVDPQEAMIGILMTQVFPNNHLEIRKEFKRLAYEAVDDSGFYRQYWYEKGQEHGNPFFNNRQLRVNAPPVSTHKTFASRSEPRSSGLARILVDEDLRTIRRARLYCEIWGGHPGTAAKRVHLNGRRLHHFPEVGTEAKHCTHQYVTFPVFPNDLVNGYNSLQFACDQGNTFWGHYIVDNACLQIGVNDRDAGMEGFRARVEAKPVPNTEGIRFRLNTTDEAAIASVAYQARYFGYDENGNGYTTDWHGMTKGREAYGMVGVAHEPPFALTWDTSMIPAQERVAVKAVLTFKKEAHLVYETPMTANLSLPGRPGERVSIHHVRNLPVPMWSRAGRRIEAVIELPVPPSSIVSAELHMVSWTGGAGEVRDYFTLNGHPLPVAEGHDHEVQHVRLPIGTELLKQGDNQLRLLSDTKHHGIEVLLPGPALVIRARE